MQETINYPAGSDKVYTLPLTNIVRPGPTDIVFTLFHGQQFFVPADRLIYAQLGAASEEGPQWVPANYFLTQTELNRGRSWFVRVVNLWDHLVEAVAITGARAEPTPVQYSIPGSTLMGITRVEPVTEWTSLVDPATVETREAASFSGCQCILTNDPCGERLAVVLFEPGTYTP